MISHRSLSLSVFGLLAAAVVATAAVTIDMSTGLGFVGKGDVQLAFGWNNAQLQNNAGGVTFSFDAVDRYEAECEWTTVTGGPNSKTIVHDITLPRNVRVNASISYDARMRNQITGFNLLGFGHANSGGTVPVVGADCPGNNPGVVTAVTLVSSTGGLYVNYGGSSVLLQ